MIGPRRQKQGATPMLAKREACWVAVDPCVNQIHCKTAQNEPMNLLFKCTTNVGVLPCRVVRGKPAKNIPERREARPTKDNMKALVHFVHRILEVIKRLAHSLLPLLFRSIKASFVDSIPNKHDIERTYYYYGKIKARLRVYKTSSGVD